MLGDKRNFYFVEFQNIGGLVMPIIVEIEFEDGSKQTETYPAEIWKSDNQRVTKLIITSQPIKSLVLDPRLQTADTDLSNNYFPPRIEKSRFQLYKEKKESNPMQKANGTDTDSAEKEESK